jgi:hypothetical protein
MELHSVAAIAAGDGNVEVRASAGDARLEVRLPSRHFNRRALGDALVLSALVPAMRAGGTLRLPRDVPVSTRLIAALPAIQRICRHWHAGLHEVALDAAACDPEVAGSGTALFYAGGVDSSYSLIAHEGEIDTLVSVFGFDMHMSDDEMAASRARNTAFARSLGKEILFVESNHRVFMRDLGVSRTFVYGAMLASIALLMGFRLCHIASSHSVGHLRPEGSHPLLDPLYSNGTTTIVHDDVTVSRLQKTRAIAGRPDILGNLRVCWDQPNDNCGACLKCLRTMAALRLCGAQGPFPPLGDLAGVRRMASHTELDYVVEMAVEAHRQGDRELLRRLRQGLRRQDFREALRYLAYAVTGRKIRRPSRGRDPLGLVKFDLRPDLDLR